MIAIIGGESMRFPLVDLYHRALDEPGRSRLPVGVHSPGHVGPTDDQAKEELWPHFKATRDRYGTEVIPRVRELLADDASAVAMAGASSA